MAWCHQATSHYLSQCWPRSLSPYGVTRPQWVNNRPALVQEMAWPVWGLLPNLIQWWLIVKGTLKDKRQWNLNQIQLFSFKKLCLSILSGKWHPFCSDSMCELKTVQLLLFTSWQILKTASKTSEVHQPKPWSARRFNTLRPRQNGRHFADNIFKCIFLDENVWISLKISLKFVPKGPINNIPALLQIMVGAVQATSHYLNQWWLLYRRINASLGLNEIMKPCSARRFRKISSAILNIII